MISSRVSNSTRTPGCARQKRATISPSSVTASGEGAVMRNRPLGVSPMEAARSNAMRASRATAWACTYICSPIGVSDTRRVLR
ncbi:hypothetical protein D3C73_986350 [compost metagenome]